MLSISLNPCKLYLEESDFYKNTLSLDAQEESKSRKIKYAIQDSRAG